MPLPRCLLHAVHALVQHYYLPPKSTTTLRQTRVHVFLKVRLHEILLNIKIAQVKIQFTRHCRQQQDTRNSNSGRKQLFEIDMNSLLILPRHKPRLCFRRPTILISFLVKNPHYIDTVSHWLLHRLESPRIQQTVKFPPRRILPKMDLLRPHRLLMAPWYLEVRRVAVQQVRGLVRRPLVVQGCVDVLPGGEQCRQSTRCLPVPPSRRLR